jgi:hypothetical protein
MFKGWDFERGVLAFMAVLVLAGVGFIFWQQSEASTLQQKLGSAESQLKQIGQIADQVLTLQKEIAEDVVASGKLGSFAYIERQEVDSKIGKKFNSQTPVTDAHPSDGYQDTKYTLQVAQQDFDFDRQEIAHFLLYLEGNTTRMKVTHLTLDLSTRKGADKDTWKPRITITDRQPVQKTGAPGAAAGR